MEDAEPGKALFDQADSEVRKEHVNVKLAVDLMTAAADAGHNMASYALATWYLFGKEPYIRVDHIKAVTLLKKAAAAGIPEALYDLGVCYSEGEGVEKDDESAFECYLRAALRGHKVSVDSVGTCYEYGIGVVEDPRVARIWHERAIELGTYWREGEDGKRGREQSYDE
jgi:TPR repeat protein